MAQIYGGSRHDPVYDRLEQGLGTPETDSLSTFLSQCASLVESLEGLAGRTSPASLARSVDGVHCLLLMLNLVAGLLAISGGITAAREASVIKAHRGKLIEQHLARMKLRPQSSIFVGEPTDGQIVTITMSPERQWAVLGEQWP